jgi:hypothetical protein
MKPQNSGRFRTRPLRSTELAGNGWSATSDRRPYPPPRTSTQNAAPPERPGTRTPPVLGPHTVRPELLGGGGAAGSDPGAHEVVDSVVGDEAAHDTVVVTTVEVQGVALGECHPFGGSGKDGARTTPTFDYKNPNRAPLLFISGSDDHLMPPKIQQSNAKHYNAAGTINEVKEFEGPHLLRTPEAPPHRPCIASGLLAP